MLKGNAYGDWLMLTLFMCNNINANNANNINMYMYTDK